MTHVTKTIVLLFIIIAPLVSYAKPADEVLMERALNLYAISGNVATLLKNSHQNNTTKEALMTYIAVKSRLEQAIALFESASTVNKIYNQSAGCKINTAETALVFLLHSKKSASYTLRQFEILKLAAKEFNLAALEQYIDLAISETGKGYEDLTNLTLSPLDALRMMNAK